MKFINIFYKLKLFGKRRVKNVNSLQSEELQDRCRIMFLETPIYKDTSFEYMDRIRYAG